MAGGRKQLGGADVSGVEQKAFDDLLADVRRARKRLDPAHVWQPTLEVLEQELEEGQPLFLRIASASESRSNNDTSEVVS
jgi:hypothetical protein